MIGIVKFVITGNVNEVYYSPEAWNPGGSVSLWTGMILASPHHVASAVAHLAGMLLLRGANLSERPAEGWVPAALAGAAFASGCGMSVWVTLVSAAAVGLYLVMMLLRGERGHVQATIVAGAVTVALSMPFLMELAASNNLAGRAPIAFQVRPFAPILPLLRALSIGRGWERSLAYLLAMPVEYFLEFGFLLVASIVYWKRWRSGGRPLSYGDAALVPLCAASIVISSFVSANVRVNDLASRGMQFAQFAMLLWSASVVAERWGPGAWTVSSLLTILRGRAALTVAVMGLLGLATTAYALAGSRAFSAYERRDDERPRQDYVHRAFYEALAARLPLDARCQISTRDMQICSPYAFYFHRPVAVFHHSFGTLFGVDGQVYEDLALVTDSLYSARTSTTQAEAIVSRLSLTAVVVSRTDTVVGRLGHVARRIRAAVAGRGSSRVPRARCGVTPTGGRLTNRAPRGTF